jgi:hypothetical protein
VTLVITFAALAVALTALFWGLGAVLQGYLYSQPADRLPLRAAVAGLLVALTLTGWTYVNTRASHRDRYGVLIGFDRMMSPTAEKPVAEFDAVRRLGRSDGRSVRWLTDDKGNPREQVTAYKWTGEENRGKFVDAAQKEFQLSSSEGVTVALEVPEDGKKVRFEADLKDGQYAPGAGGERVFKEVGGGRFIDGSAPRKMQIPSPGAMTAGLLINLGQLAAWLVAFWVVLRFGFGHALGLAAVFGVTTAVVLMPLLFNANDPKPTPQPPLQQPSSK